MNQAIAVFRPFRGFDHRYLAWHLLSRAALDWYKKKAKATVGQVNLTLEICRATPVPLPSPNEQLEIIQLIELEMSRLANLAAAQAEDRRLATGLRQAVLKAAFSGDLVPQHSSDEPASALLARIATERNAVPGKPSRGLQRKHEV